MIRQYKALLTATFIRCCTQHVYFSFVTTIRRTAKCKPCRDIVNKLVPEVVLYVPRLQTASTQRSCLHISTLLMHKFMYSCITANDIYTAKNYVFNDITFTCHIKMLLKTVQRQYVLVSIITQLQFSELINHIRIQPSHSINTIQQRNKNMLNTMLKFVPAAIAPTIGPSVNCTG